MATGDDARRIDEDPLADSRGQHPDADATVDGEPTLPELRLRIQALASPSGRYVVACARTGDSPVPVDGYRFDTRGTAAEAAAYAEQYRARLRSMDPRAPYYDPIVHEVGTREAKDDGPTAAVYVDRPRDHEE